MVLVIFEPLRNITQLTQRIFELRSGTVREFRHKQHLLALFQPAQSYVTALFTPTQFHQSKSWLKHDSGR